MSKSTSQRPVDKGSVRRFGAIFSTPLINVGALVLIIVAVIGGMRLLAKQGSQAQLKFIENGAPEAKTVADERIRAFGPPEIFSGEAYDATVRLREAGAIGMAVSLAVFSITAETKSFPTELRTVLASVSSRGLMPPGLSFEGNVLRSATSIFDMRYRPEPFAFEVMGRPLRNGEGPAVLLKFPLVSADGRTITYFLADTSKGFAVPPAFATPDALNTAGWSLRQWRGELIQNGDAVYGELEKERRLLREMTTVP